jgi:hypothetical protein
VFVPQGAVAPVTANADVNAILSSLLAGSAPPPYQTPVAPVYNPGLASILQSLGGQQPTSATVQQNIDINALLSQFQPQPAAQQQRWTSPPPSTIPRREERHREPERERVNKKRDRDPGTWIKASRSDDIRESVRNSHADPKMYRALCQFYVHHPPSTNLSSKADSGFRRRGLVV